ncbi:MAG: hypothetical protein OXH06_04525 [Gemmatimonadetes bacterium]|nr:hypothetical protein [Gemmatimonadota bacterium]
METLRIRSDQPGHRDVGRRPDAKGKRSVTGARNATERGRADERVIQPGTSGVDLDFNP